MSRVCPEFRPSLARVWPEHGLSRTLHKDFAAGLFGSISCIIYVLSIDSTHSVTQVKSGKFAGMDVFKHYCILISLKRIQFISLGFILLHVL